MNSKDSNLFKRFLNIHGMNTMFAGFYNQFKYDDNPETVQEYLNQVPRDVVIPYAFDASKIKTAYGAKYWDEMNEKWHHFIGKSDVRKGMEIPAIEREEKEIKREEKRAKEEQSVFENDWSGLDLLNVNANSPRKVPMPDDNEIRVNTKNKNCVVLNPYLVKVLDSEGLDSMSIRVDRNTNKMVLVFGNNLQFNVSKYSTDTKALNGKAIIAYLEKYLEVKFDPELHYYIRIAQRLWNNTHTNYAIVLAQRFTTK